MGEGSDHGGLGLGADDTRGGRSPPMVLTTPLHPTPSTLRTKPGAHLFRSNLKETGVGCEGGYHGGLGLGADEAPWRNAGLLKLSR